LSALPLTSDKLCEEKSAFSFLIGKIESESRCFTKFPEIADGSAEHKRKTPTPQEVVFIAPSRPFTPKNGVWLRDCRPDFAVVNLICFVSAAEETKAPGDENLAEDEK
jgi:hypothetical protein